MNGEEQSESIPTTEMKETTTGIQKMKIFNSESGF